MGRPLVSPLLRTFVESQPWIVVSILLAVTNLGWQIYTGNFSQNIAVLMGAILFFGFLYSYGKFTSKKYSNILDEFQKLTNRYPELTGSREDYGPLSLMSRLTSQVEGNERREIWNLMQESAEVIHGILVHDLLAWDESTRRDARLNEPVDPESREPLKHALEELWRILRLHRGNVIEIMLRLRTERDLRDSSFKDAYSRFKTMYNDYLMNLRLAQERANSEFGFALDLNTIGMLIPE